MVEIFLNDSDAVNKCTITDYMKCGLFLEANGHSTSQKFSTFDGTCIFILCVKIALTGCYSESDESNLHTPIF
jgi:hypothetical protein